MRCHFKDEKLDRRTLYTFQFDGGGFNQVYAKDKEDAYTLAVESFSNGPARLQVAKCTITEVRNVTAYYNNFPCID